MKASELPNSSAYATSYESDTNIFACIKISIVGLTSRPVMVLNEWQVLSTKSVDIVVVASECTYSDILLWLYVDGLVTLRS